jgi:hypothetical protein
LTPAPARARENFEIWPPRPPAPARNVAGFPTLPGTKNLLSLALQKLHNVLGKQIFYLFLLKKSELIITILS